MLNGMALLPLSNSNLVLVDLLFSHRGKEINQHIAAPIRRSNRKPQAIHYTDIHATVQEKTGKKMSLRTIQSYGKEKLQAKKKSTNKRTHILRVS
jgi:hypothetical protein